ncbi:uncharacterized protein LOC141648524 [Silene latifolia]|uniref:uncharacterized protein LOC141648524 n=1 Tax=Silene latifolia TaxID=37657 RepID=UPI003D774230
MDILERPFFHDKYLYDEIEKIIECDDKERFLSLISKFPDSVCMRVVEDCAFFHARKCLLAIIEGEVSISALEIYAKFVPHFPETPTPLAVVARFFHEAYDIIELLLKRGPVEHAKIKGYAFQSVFYDDAPCAYPLDHLLTSLSDESHLYPWAPGTSLNKLIILLCQWETNASLKSARLLAPHTDGINVIAWTYVRDGRLVSLAALLLVAREKVFVPFDSGLTIRQRIVEIVDALHREGDLDHEAVKYQSMLVEARELLDIFERAGDALSLYCSSMHEYVPPHKVLIDVANLLKKTGHTLRPMDLDLRDCFRKCPEVKKASLFKLSDPESPSNKYLLPPSLTRAQSFCATGRSYPSVGDCQLFHKLKSGPMLNFLPSASVPRLLRTAASQVEDTVLGNSQKHFAYIAFLFKRGIKFSI